MTDLIVNPEYRFTSEIAGPDGITVTVTVVAPAMSVVSARLASDLSELANGGAGVTAHRISEAIKADRERCPF